MKHYIAEIGGVPTEIIESAGTGLPVFFFHGNSSCAQAYAPLFSSILGARYRLIAASFPGHGASGYYADPDAALSIASLGAFTAQVTRHIGAERYVLAGQSLGGHALLESLALHGKAAGLCLISAPPISRASIGQAFGPDPLDGLLFKRDLSEEQTVRFAGAFLQRNNEDHLRTLADHVRRTDGRFREALGASLAQGLIEDEVAAFENAGMPVAMLRGAHDRFLRADYYDGLNRQRLWSGSVITFPDAGHAIGLDDPAGLHDVLLRFVDSVAGARA